MSDKSGRSVKTSECIACVFCLVLFFNLQDAIHTVCLVKIKDFPRLPFSEDLYELCCSYLIVNILFFLFFLTLSHPVSKGYTY